MDVVERFESIGADVRVAKGVTQEAVRRADKYHREVLIPDKAFLWEEMAVEFE